MSVMPAFGREARVNLLIATGHFFSHFYILCLPLMFLQWQKTFGVSFAQLGLAITLMSGACGLLQTPVGFLVDRYGARPFLVGGTLLMTLSMAAMSFATAYWQILILALFSGVGNSVIHPSDYAILAGSINRHRMGRAFALHTFSGNLGNVCAPPVTRRPARLQTSSASARSSAARRWPGRKFRCRRRRGLRALRRRPRHSRSPGRCAPRRGGGGGRGPRRRPRRAPARSAPRPRRR